MGNHESVATGALAAIPAQKQCKTDTTQVTPEWHVGCQRGAYRVPMRSRLGLVGWPAERPIVAIATTVPRAIAVLEKRD